MDLDMAVECEVKERDAARKELAEAKAALEAANARIAELDRPPQMHEWLKRLSEALARAERAEAECEVWKEEVEYSAKNPVIRFLNERARAERAEARIAELEDQLSSTQTVRKMNAAVADLALANTDSWKARAERAEARIAELEAWKAHHDLSVT